MAYKDELKKLIASLKTLITNLTRREQTINIECPFDSTNNVFNVNPESVIKDLNSLINQNNSYTDTLTSKINSARQKLLNDEVLEFISLSGYFENKAELEDLHTTVDSFSDKLTSLSREIRNKQETIRDLEQRKQDMTRGVDIINRLLTTAMPNTPLRMDAVQDPFDTTIRFAIKRNEKICIYGDYDVDGITSITIMYKFLTKLGLDVMYYLPDRLVEGYGINNNALEEIKEKGVTLIITVDCGITAIDEIEYAKKLGLDVCVTDHHECTEKLPDAYVVINPKRKDDNSKFKMLAGVGVAFKCLMAIAKKYNLPKESYLKYLDIVSIGTISDIVPLVGENRIISKYCLNLMEKTKTLGLK